MHRQLASIACARLNHPLNQAWTNGNPSPLRAFILVENLLDTLSAMLNDFRYAFRQLLKNRGFTAVAVLTLALGIGVNTSMFTALQALLARPLPYPDERSLVQVFQSSRQSPRQSHHSAPNFLDYQQSGE